MKRKWHHPEEPRTGRRYFRSIAELEGAPESPEWFGQEFPEGVAEMEGEEDAELTRRSFLRVMGGTGALAGLGLAGCRRPEATIRPFTEHVEWMVPGRSLFYATAMPRLGGCTPLVATTYEGRPTHLQGNPLHPYSNGSTDAFATAAVRDLYDPGRSMKILSKGKQAKREDFAKFLAKLIANAGDGSGIGFLVGESTSPTCARLISEIATKFPEAKFFKHEAITFGSAEAAYETVLGKGVRPVPRFKNAKRIFSLDCDFLGLEAGSAGEVSDFMAARRPESLDAPEVPSVEGMNRLYVVESRYSLTGGMADHRKPMAAGQIVTVASALAREISGAELGPVRQGVGVDDLDQELLAWVKAAAEDLKENAGASLVVAGLNQPPAVHALAAAMNQVLGAYGTTADLVQTPVGEVTMGTLADLKLAVGRKQVMNLFLLGPSNPVYDAPQDLGWHRVHAELENTVHIGHRVDATAMASTWHIPAAHFLESWGDVRDSSGVYSVVQPMILPLFEGLSEIDLYLAVLGKKILVPDPVAAPEGEAAVEEVAVAGPDPAHLAVRETFAGIAGGEVEEAWNFTLRDGFLKGSKYEILAGEADLGAAAALVNGAAKVSIPSAGAMEIVFTPDASVWDGRYIDNPWLQETPDPISKVAWDNVATASPRTLRGLNGGKAWKAGRALKITVGDREIEVPALEAPGHPQNSITLPLGYGQPVAGAVGKGSGFNAYKIRTSLAPYIVSGAVVSASEREFDIVQVQEHYSIEGRAIVREDTSEGYTEDPDGTRYHGMDSHIPENISLYKGQVGRKSEENPNGFDYEREHQWGMAIDLNSCIGCTACLVSCVSENNIPVVGREQVKRGRVMHWIRMDRYFATTDDVSYDPGLDELDNPEMITQPVACQQCESAPCETVCPVNATVHTEEGLNAMAYNRCIGTRYCANNCPYKARRFNFFDYNKRDTNDPGNLYKGPLGERKDFGVENLQRNPNVTVRMRGVMEKCTYCVQRLEAAKIDQRRKARDSKDVRVRTDSVKTACQQACPADAIYFGDLADPKSTINKVKKVGRNYDLLKYIGTLPRTSYLARIKNPNPKMPKGGNDQYLMKTKDPENPVPVKSHGKPVERIGGASKWVH